ncbi:LOW QUALITY PROTEIN: hypothetical protein OSB04_024110 [Centaurea solstitialis]|uniref:Uncharacterized protein n=1 Tax=Centaurea solstitialis TaxID=347529 RepID=A0AA38T4Z9_9ASTR|nr:LOW QUALITY PROTEIN: hypothetical protein OSB04_024110 [Centaurea solstitialis]
MASTVTSTNNLSLRSILEKDKLTGPNFLDWERNLMIVLRHERKWYVLEEPLGEAPPANAPAAARNAHKKHSDDLLDVACLMLATMSPDLQAGLINTNAYDMIRQLRDMFQTQARTERYDATKAFNECKMVRGTSVSDHVMKMKRHLDHLERLGHPVPLQLATDTILNSLSEDYRPFVVNYNMNNMEKTIAELHSMLKTAELNMGNKNKTKDVLMTEGLKRRMGKLAPVKEKDQSRPSRVHPRKARARARARRLSQTKLGPRIAASYAMKSVIGGKTALSVMKQEVRNEVKCPGVAEDLNYDQLLNNSYKCCRLKVAQIFDRVANIGRDPRLRLLLGSSHNPTRGTFAGRSLVDLFSSNQDTHKNPTCISLKKEIAYLKSNGHLKNLLSDDSKRPTSPVPTKVVNCITGGSEVCGLTYSAAKRHAREGPEGHPIPNESRTAEEKELDATKISFDIEDMSDAHQKHHDALVIQLTIGNCLTKRVLIDGGSSANVIFAETLKIMGIDRSNIVRRTTTLIGFNGDATSTLGEIILLVFAKGINKQTKFNVIDCPSAYNAILGRPWIHDMKAVPSTYHQKIKFPSPWGVQEISQDGVRSYDDLQLEEVVVDHKHPDRKVFVGATLTPDIKNSIISFFQEHSDCFAWSHEDMVGIDPNIISHKLNVDPTFKPVKQKRRKFAPERNMVINEEVENLLKTGKIREVKYPDWLANMVVVQKKNGKWRVCIDFTDLNKACPKDPFPLPHIDAMVDATAGHELLTFMVAYSGYNQILMHKDDQEKTAFMTDKGIYCYKVMPFGLKNAGSTYQRLVNRMFKDHLGRTMEVYIDDMLVKSERSQDHIQHLKQSFDILREYKMKLNPTKCSFGVRAGKFFGYMVTRRGIEASPEQIKAILEIQSPRNVKEVQKLTGRVAALNRFISRSSDKCHLFYNNKGFDWTEAHEEALQSLKKYMSNPPLLTKPIEGESLQLYLAVSNNAVSAVLVREGDQHQQPIYYISKSFLDAETRYTSMEKLLLGLVTAAKKLRHYFESHHIIVVTNYPLKIVLRKPELTGRLAKWSIYLSSFDLTYQPRTAIKSQALADFVAEFSPGIEEPSYDEISNVMIHDNEPWTMHVDGASNARGSGLGVVLKSSHGGNMVYSIRCEFKTTNNEAEYEALIAGLDMAYNLGARWLHVRSDSLLVVNQINGEFQAKDSKMISYLKIAKDKIARFDKFSIEQIPRDLNMQADALANLGSAFNEPTLESVPIIHLMSPTIEEAQMIEENHDWSNDIWNYLKNDQLPEDKLEARKVRLKSSRYTIFDDQLYRRSTTGLILRCVVNRQQIDQILQEMHDGECGNHSGGRSLANRISRQGYYWPTLREDSIRYVQRCDACQRHSGTSHLPSEPLHSVLIPWPFMRWGMDIVGKLPPAPGQKVFLLVLTDYFSKWIEAAAFSQVRDKEVISFIQTNIIYRFGVPSEITCDNGSQFISERTRKFCDERGIKLITSTPRYPQSNGLAESSNKTIINSIRKRLKAAKGRWVEELPSVLWANRTTPRTSTGQTPFSLVYGCEAVLPIESQVPVARHRTIEQNSIDLCYDIDALEELREKAFQKMASQKAMVERYFNKKVKVKVFQVGDHVLRRVFPNTQESNAGKLSIKWEGPYIITKIVGKGAYKISTIEGNEIPRSWNATHLKRYYF